MLKGIASDEISYAAVLTLTKIIWKNVNVSFIKNLTTCSFFNLLWLKGTVSVIESDPECQDMKDPFTMVPFKPLSE